MVSEKSQIKSSFRYLLAISLTLSLLGLVFIYSSSCVFAAEKFGFSGYFLKRQAIYLALSFIAFFVCALIPTGKLKGVTPLLFLFSLISVLLTFVPSLSYKVHGSNRWISLFGFTLQPSEFLKLFLFPYLSFLLERKTSRASSLLYHYSQFIIIIMTSCLILLKQPDFGGAVNIFITAFILFFISGVKTAHLLSIILFAVPSAITAILFKSYRLKRIMIFLNPWADPQGQGYQIIQSLIAIGSGGLWGVGIANSRQKFFYLPMQHTDFIFSIIAEESGLIGSLLVIGLYLLFLYWGLKVALGMEGQFAFGTTICFVVLITLQATINLMVVCGLLPTKGLGLPFVSYGGSSLIANYCMLGFIAGFVRERSS